MGCCIQWAPNIRQQIGSAYGQFRGAPLCESVLVSFRELVKKGAYLGFEVLDLGVYFGDRSGWVVPIEEARDRDLITDLRLGVVHPRIRGPWQNLSTHIRVDRSSMRVIREPLSRSEIGLFPQRCP